MLVHQFNELINVAVDHKVQCQGQNKNVQHINNA